MGKRRADADSRRFFDEFDSVKASYFRGRDVIDPAKHEALIPFPNGKTKLLAVKHTRFWNGGGWSFFVCPGCARRASKLYLIGDAPRCVKCCDAMNIRHRAEYGFGRDARRQAADKHLDELIAKLESPTRLAYKPHHPSWLGKAQIIENSRKLTIAKQRSLISLRLGQLVNQQAAQRGYEPLAETKSLINIKPIWRAKTAEALQRALDKAQHQIIKALDSDDPQVRIAANKLMLRTKQARDRGLA